MDKPKKVPNTTEETQSPEGAQAFLAEAMLHSLTGGDPSDAILAQEARGQRDLAQSNQLPVDGSPGSSRCSDEDAEVWAAMGIEWGPIDPKDIFRNALLPEGWKIQPTEHSMHSDLVDEKGRKRAGIFYKAAFYDRSANIHLTARFHVQRDYTSPETKENRNMTRYQVTDGGEVVFSTEWVDLGDRAQYGTDEYTAREKRESDLRAIAKEWVESRYPNWQRADAHWNDE